MNSNYGLHFQKQQINDIFQVNINSNKLISILKQLQQNHKKLQKKVERIDEYYKQGDMALNRKMLNAESTMKILVQKQTINMKVQIQTEMRKHEQKYIKQLLQKENKINQLKYSIQTLNEKINKTNSELVNQIQTVVRNYSAQVFCLKRTFQKSQQTFKNQIQQMFQKIQTCKSDIEDNKQNVFDMEIKVKKFTQFFSRSTQANYIACPDKKFQDSINGQKYSNFIQDDPFKKNKNQSVGKERFRKQYNNKSNLGSLKKSKIFSTSNGMQQKQKNQNYMSTLQYASISAKVQDLEKKLLQNNDKTKSYTKTQRQSVFKRGGKTSMMKTFSFSPNGFQENFDQNQVIEETNFQNISENQIVQEILNRFDNIEKIIQTKEKNLKKQIQEIRQKEIIASQKADFLKQKHNKITSQIAQVKIKLLALQKKNSKQTQAQAITNIESQLGKIIQRLDKQFNLKLDTQTFNQEKNKINQKLRMIQENIIYKAQKQDVKKAVNFLEDKIKQIILVLANEFNEQKLGAISKISHPKCLTCDKQVLKLENITNMEGLNGFKGVNSSKSSRQLNQKYYTRLLKPKKQNNENKKRHQNYTSMTQVTQQKENVINFS